MSMFNRDKSGLRLSCSGRNWFAILIFLLSSIAYLSCQNATAEANQAIAQDLSSFFEAFLGRRLSNAEQQSLPEEFARLHTAKGRNREAIERIARELASYAKILREQKGSPADLSLRHALLETNYFQPILKNTVELRLFTEPDPVRVVNSRSKRLMTEKDIVAIINLNHFAASNLDPQPLSISRQQIDRLANELNRLFGDQPKARLMPRFCGEAAPLWAGVRKEWPSLNADERQQTRAYAGKGFKAPLRSYKLYARLFEIDANTALKRRMDDMSSVALYIAEIDALGTIIRTEMGKMR